MSNPLRIVGNQLLLRSPSVLLIAGIALAAADFGVLYVAAERDAVLRIPNGVGLLTNYGLLSTILGNALLPYLAKKYVDSVRSIKNSRALTERDSIAQPAATLTAMLRMDGQYAFLAYALVSLGAACWVSNVGVHLFGSPVTRWGHRVFDSTDHRLSFYASRFHLFYTWVIVLPFVGHVMIFTSIQVRQLILTAVRAGTLRYDLLNPDRKGGFRFIDHAHVVFNMVVALVYLETTMHIDTFERANVDHIVAFLVATLLLLWVNRIFLNDVYSEVAALKTDALNDLKDKAYGDDAMSFEILKYCYERRLNEFSLVNFGIKLGAILASSLVKLWPIISKTFTAF